MTNERAIELLNRISDSQFDGIHGDERREALEMAVRALEGDGDTIYRQQAIDALNNILANYVPYLHGLTECIPLDCAVAIKALPSAQPEIIACGSGELVQEPDGLVEVLVKDCISRKVATDINVGDTISRKGVFIPDITVEMFRNASLEGVEDLMASGEMEDISLPSAYPEIIRCKDCKWFGEVGCAIRIVDDSDKPNEEDFCSFAER